MFGRRVWLALIGATVVVGCAAPLPLVVSPGDPDGRSLERVVDSESARQLLFRILSEEAPVDDGRSSGTVSDVTFDSAAAFARPADQQGPAPVVPLPGQAELQALARQVSNDFAALTFALALGADAKSRAIREVFDQAVEEGPARSEAALTRPGAFPYTVLFAPGWLYVSHPESGASFAPQRALLDRLGVTNSLIETAESGSIEDNARTIAGAIRDAARTGKPVVLVSASKAGAEVAFALSELVEPADAAQVVGWLNVGGALNGTPLADRALKAPASWFVRLAFRLVRWDRAGLLAMRTGAIPSEALRLPSRIAVVNLVPIPVSGSVGKKVRGGYWFMRNVGPTDGVVPIADSVWPGGANLVALGSDHLLTAYRDETLGLALLRALDFAIRQHGRERDGSIARIGGSGGTPTTQTP